MKKNNESKKESSQGADSLPIKESAESIKGSIPIGNTDTGNTSNNPVFGAPIKRGRGRPRKNPLPNLPPFPKEALVKTHVMVWNGIAAAMQSEFQLSESAANEMAEWASICLQQYVGPLLGQHVPLACYTMTQLTAFGVCLAMRKPKEKGKKDGKE